MNYADIRADDPGGSIESALAALSATTKTVSLSENLINERTIYSKLGGVAGETFLTALSTFAPNQDHPLAAYAPVVARIVSWLSPEKQGIDICSTEVQTVLNTLAANGDLVQADVNSLIELASEETLKYPNIRYGDIQKARAAE